MHIDFFIRHFAMWKSLRFLRLLNSYEIKTDSGEIVDLPAEIIEIYGYRNAIHLVAERRKGIEYEIALSKKAYRRMRPFIDQIKECLRKDCKGIYAQHITE